MLKPANVPIVIQEGVDFYFPFCFQHDDGSTKDTAGWTATFTVYTDAARETLAFPQLTTENGGVEVGIQDGGDFGDYNVLLVMLAPDTSDLEDWGDGLYDLDLIDPFGHPQRWAQSSCLLERGTDHG